MTFLNTTTTSHVNLISLGNFSNVDCGGWNDNAEDADSLTGEQVDYPNLSLVQVTVYDKFGDNIIYDDGFVAQIGV